MSQLEFDRGGKQKEAEREKPVRLALLGCGTVGSEVVRLLHAQAGDLTARIGAPLEIVGIAVRRLGRERGDLPIDPALFTTDALGLVKRDDVDVVIEVVGGIEPARTWLVEALRAGRSVVTANKALLAEDGGALHDAAYSATVAGRLSTEAPILARVVGKHCEAGDIIVKDEFLPADVRAGDLIAVPGTGAYCRSMASNYNHVPRPPVVAVRDGAARVIVRRETEDDLLALDVG